MSSTTLSYVTFESNLSCSFLRMGGKECPLLKASKTTAWIPEKNTWEPQRRYLDGHRVFDAFTHYDLERDNLEKRRPWPN